MHNHFCVHLKNNPSTHARKLAAQSFIIFNECFLGMKTQKSVESDKNRERELTSRRIIDGVVTNNLLFL